MTTLFLDYIPQDLEAVKDQDLRGKSIVGGGIYAFDVVKAILKYSSFDKIQFLYAVTPVGGDIRDTLHEEFRSGRVSCVAEHQLLTLRDEADLLLFATGSRLPSLDRIRRAIGRTDVPIVGAIHTISFRSYLGVIYKLLSLPLAPFDALLCSTTAGRTAIEHYVQQAHARAAVHGSTDRLADTLRLPLIPLGVQVEDFERERNPTSSRIGPPCDVLILCFGRLSRNTKADLFPLLLTFRRLLTYVPQAGLVIAGDDTQEQLGAELSNFAVAIGCRDKVVILANPTSQQKHALFEEADIFVAPSDNLQETFGITLLEAMAAGLAVVASDWNGYKDLITNGENGFLIKTTFPMFGNDFDVLRGSGTLRVTDLLSCTTALDLTELFAALKLLLMDASLRKRLGDAGNKRVRTTYDWPVIVRRYDELWMSLIKEARSTTFIVPGATLDLEGYSYKDIFPHYPSSHLTRRTLLTIGAQGQELPRDVVIPVLAQPSTWFSPERMNRMVDLLGPSRKLEAGELIDELRESTGWPEMEILSYIARFLKYGLLEANFEGCATVLRLSLQNEAL